jgi:hypothetical protein
LVSIFDAIFVTFVGAINPSITARGNLLPVINTCLTVSSLEISLSASYDR